MSKIETQEKLIEIAHRMPPGDNWKVTNVNEIQKSITDFKGRKKVVVTNHERISSNIEIPLAWRN